ncbi:MAG: hypothetical protein ACREQK_10025 [Candidatus Binatia bacterium]
MHKIAWIPAYAGMTKPTEARESPLYENGFYRLTDTLTEEERQEFKELAASAAIREEFRLLRSNSRAAGPIDVDALIVFLSAMARLSSVPARRRPFVPYPSVKL